MAQCFSYNGNSLSKWLLLFWNGGVCNNCKIFIDVTCSATHAYQSHSNYFVFKTD